MLEARSQMNVFDCHSSSSLSPQASKSDFTVLGFSVSANLELKLYQNSHRLLTGWKLPSHQLPPQVRDSHMRRKQSSSETTDGIQKKSSGTAYLAVRTREQYRALLRWSTPALAGAQSLYKLITTWLKNYISPLDERKVFSIFSRSVIFF